MLKLRPSFAVAVPVLLSACASGPPFIDTLQPAAIDVAVRRGAF